MELSVCVCQRWFSLLLSQWFSAYPSVIIHCPNFLSLSSFCNSSSYFNSKVASKLPHPLGMLAEREIIDLEMAWLMKQPHTVSDPWSIKVCTVHSGWQLLFEERSQIQKNCGIWDSSVFLVSVERYHWLWLIVGGDWYCWGPCQISSNSPLPNMLFTGKSSGKPIQCQTRSIIGTVYSDCVYVSDIRFTIWPAVSFYEWACPDIHTLYLICSFPSPNLIMSECSWKPLLGA